MSSLFRPSAAFLIVVAAILLAPGGDYAGAPPNEESGARSRRVAKPPYAPTPQDVVEKMLQVVPIGENDTVSDLGSGDGRIVITAAKLYGATGVGYEIDGDLVVRSRASAQEAGVAELVEIRRQDMYAADLCKADVVTVYLYPAALEKLRPQFHDMKPGAWIISHHYEIPGLQPLRVVRVTSKETGNEHRILLYAPPR